MLTLEEAKEILDGFDITYDNLLEKVNEVNDFFSKKQNAECGAFTGGNQLSDPQPCNINDVCRGC